MLAIHVPYCRVELFPWARSEDPNGLESVLRKKTNVVAPPARKHVLLERDEVESGVDRLEHADTISAPACTLVQFAR